MPGITLIAADPGEDVSGVALASIDLPVLNIPPVRLWIHQFSAHWDIYVAGEDGQIPDHGRTLDIPLDEAEYREFLDAVDLAKEA